MLSCPGEILARLSSSLGVLTRYAASSYSPCRWPQRATLALLLYSLINSFKKCVQHLLGGRHYARHQAMMVYKTDMVSASLALLAQQEKKKKMIMQ